MLLFDKILDGEALVTEVLKSHGHISDENGNEHWWNTIDRTKKYQVKKYEDDRALQDYSVISYKIKEL